MKRLLIASVLGLVSLSSASAASGQAKIEKGLYECVKYNFHEINKKYSYSFGLDIAAHLKVNFEPGQFNFKNEIGTFSGHGNYSLGVSLREDRVQKEYIRLSAGQAGENRIVIYPAVFVTYLKGLVVEIGYNGSTNLHTYLCFKD